MPLNTQVWLCVNMLENVALTKYNDHPPLPLKQKEDLTGLNSKPSIVVPVSQILAKSWGMWGPCGCLGILVPQNNCSQWIAFLKLLRVGRDSFSQVILDRDQGWHRAFGHLLIFRFSLLLHGSWKCIDVYKLSHWWTPWWTLRTILGIPREGR